MEQADEFADLGITCIWLPPPTDSVSPQGYMPGDLYNLNSKYGSQEDLKRYSYILMCSKHCFGLLLPAAFSICTVPAARTNCWSSAKQATHTD